MYEHRSAPLLPLRQFVLRLIRHGGLIVALLVVSLTVGILGYHVLARMTWIDAFLNAAMILGGMGPVDILTSDGAKLFAGLYALYCGVFFLVIAGLILAPFLHRVLHVLNLDTDDADSSDKPAH